MIDFVTYKVYMYQALLCECLFIHVHFQCASTSKEKIICKLVLEIHVIEYISFTFSYKQLLIGLLDTQKQPHV